MNNLVIIGHPDKKSFCHNGIFNTITKILSQHQNQNTKTIDLYEDKLHEGKKQLIESYKKKVLWAERIYFISPIWWFRLTPKMETFFDGVSHWITNELDTDKMELQLGMFLGEHNFTSFRSSSCNAKNPIKNVSYVELKTVENFIIITVSANAFLQNMVRIMVGTLLDIAKNEIDLTIKEILEKQDRQYAGKTAPAKGLFFLGPKYKEENIINSYLPNLFDRFKH